MNKKYCLVYGEAKFLKQLFKSQKYIIGYGIYVPELYQIIKIVFGAIALSIRAKGLRKTFRELVTLDQARAGLLRGVDSQGNEYYENRDDVANRDRWVNYAKWDYDASQIPPQWHQW